MAKSSIHIKRAVDGIVGHNSREHFSYSVVFTDDGETNECTHTVEEAYKIYRAELKERTEAYEKRTGQRLQKSAVTQLSALINLEQHHTLKDLEKIKKHLEKTFNTKVYQMAIHRDEGKLISKIDGTELYSGKDFFLNPEDKKFYFDKQFTEEIDMNDYEMVKNYHAHIEMMGLDNDGNAIRQKMNRTELKKMQTFVAKALKMERGKESVSYSQDEMKQILAITGKKSDYESSTLFAKKFNEVAKELGIYKEKRKRKDTHQFKEIGAIREEAKREAFKELSEVKKEISTLKGQVTKNKNEKAKLKEELEKLKDESKDLRAELQLNKAEREAYQQLDYLNKELQEQLKTGRKSFDEALKELEDLREQLLKKDEVIQDLEEVKKANEYLKSSIEMKEIDILDLNSSNKALEELKEVLEHKVTNLEKKTAYSPNMKEYEAIKDNLELQKEDKKTFFQKAVIKIKEMAQTIKEQAREILVLKNENFELKEKLKAQKNSNLSLEDRLNLIQMKTKATESEAPKEIKKESKDQLAQLVEKMEAGTGSQERSSNFEKSKEVQEEEKSNTKKRGFGRSR